MACPTHLSLLVVVLVFIVAWIFVPNAVHDVIVGVSVLFVGVDCGGGGWGFGGGGYMSLLKCIFNDRVCMFGFGA